MADTKRFIDGYEEREVFDDDVVSIEEHVKWDNFEAGYLAIEQDFFSAEYVLANNKLDGHNIPTDWLIRYYYKTKELLDLYQELYKMVK